MGVCQRGGKLTMFARGAFRATRTSRIFQGQDAWRDHPLVAAKNNMKPEHMLPGFTNAVGIFGVYLILDAAATAVSNSGKNQAKGEKAIRELAKLKKEHGIADSH